MRDDVCECAVERALSVEGALELQEGAVPLVGRLLGQGERLLAPHRVVPAMREGLGTLFSDIGQLRESAQGGPSVQTSGLH